MNMSLETEQLQGKLDIAYSVIEEQKTMIRGLVTEIAELKNSGHKIHNARNAGRKQLATLEQKRETMELHGQGYSLSQIVRALNVPWNKGTIKNIIEREKNNKSAEG